MPNNKTCKVTFGTSKVQTTMSTFGTPDYNALGMQPHSHNCNTNSSNINNYNPKLHSTAPSQLP